MPTILLTVDLGNTRCKLRTWPGDVSRPEVPLDGADLPVGSGLAAALARWLSAGPPVQACAFSGVAPDAAEERLLDVLRSGVRGRVEAALDPGVDNACRNPETVGRDRLFAARAAAALTGRSTVVVDAGTALTVDAVEHPRSGAGPSVFLGGAIAPGPRLMAAALSAGGARLPEFEPRPGAPALGRETGEALAGGTSVGFAGAARALIEAVGREAAFVAAPVVLTGGAAPFLACLDDALGVEVHRDPDLVHRGLLAAWHDAAGERGGTP